MGIARGWKTRKAGMSTPKESLRVYRVSMLQSWRDSLPAALKSLPETVITRQGYTEGSTEWAVIAESTLREPELNDLLRAALRGFQGYLKIEELSKRKPRVAKTSPDCAYCGCGGDGLHDCGVCHNQGIDGPVIRGTAGKMMPDGGSYERK
jgi:hypothetical protein